MSRSALIQSIDSMLERSEEISARTPGGTHALDSLGELYQRWGIVMLEEANDEQLAEAHSTVAKALGLGGS